jgi:hypothetical protein
VLAASSGDADGAVGAGERALRDWHTRRVGLAWSLAAIGGVIVLLLLIIREIERRSGDGAGRDAEGSRH